MRYFWLSYILLFVACHEQNKNKISPAELVKSREIKKVSEAEILQGGGKLGDEIMQRIDKITQQRFSIDSLDCELADWLEIDSLAMTYSADIRIVSNKTVTEQIESELLEAYQYNLDNNLAPTASIQKMDNKTVLYAYPIGKETKIFGYCMDSVRRQNAEMWSLRIPVKVVINRL